MASVTNLYKLKIIRADGSVLVRDLPPGIQITPKPGEQFVLLGPNNVPVQPIATRLPNGHISWKIPSAKGIETPDDVLVQFTSEPPASTPHSLLHSSPQTDALHSAHATDATTVGPPTPSHATTLGSASPSSALNAGSWIAGISNTTLAIGAAVAGVGITAVAVTVEKKSENSGPSTPAPTLSLDQDTGPSNNDKVTSNAVIDVGGLVSGATWQYSVDGGDWITGTGSQITDIQGDGQHLVSARQTAAGVTSDSSATLTFTLLTSAPPLSLSLNNNTGLNSSPPLYTSDATVNVSGLENGASWEYSVDGGITWIPGQGNQITEIQSQSDGSKQVLARQTDLAGNLSPSTELDFTLLTSVNAPVLVLAQDTGAQVNNPGFTTNGIIDVNNLSAAVATWQYSIDNGVSWTPGATTGQAADKITIQTLGTYSVMARQTDLANNQSADSALLNFTLSGIPVVTIVNDGSTMPGFYYDSSTASNVIVSGTITEMEPNGQVTITFSDSNNATVPGSATVQADNSWTSTPIDLRSLQNGYLTLIVSGTNKANGTGTAPGLEILATSVTPPSLQLVQSVSITGGATVTTSPTISVSNLAVSGSWQYSLDNGQNWLNGSPSTTGSSSITVAADGLYNVIARQTDVANNQSGNSSALTFTLEAQPTLTITGDSSHAPTDGTNYYFYTKTTEQNVVVSGNSLEIEPGQTVTITFTDSNTVSLPPGSALVVAGGGWTSSPINLSGLADGVLTLTASASNLAGAKATASGPNPLFLHASVPPVTLALQTDTGFSQTDKVTSIGQVNAKVVQGLAWYYTVDTGSGPGPNQLGPSNNQISFMTDGTYTVNAYQTDFYGNLSSPAPLTFTLITALPAAPTITDALDASNGTPPASVPTGGTTHDSSTIIEVNGGWSPGGTAAIAPGAYLTLIASPQTTITNNSAHLTQSQINGSSIVPFTLPSLANTPLDLSAPYQFTATLTDIAGNISNTSAPFALNVNATNIAVQLAHDTTNTAITGPVSVTGTYTSDGDINVMNVNTGNTWSATITTTNPNASAITINKDFTDTTIGASEIGPAGQKTVVATQKTSSGNPLPPSNPLVFNYETSAIPPTITSSNSINKFATHTTTDLLGSSIASAGDINNDGINDLIIGAAGLSVGQQGAGGAYIIFGKQNAIGDLPSLSNSNSANVDFLIQGMPNVSTPSNSGASLTPLGNAITAHSVSPQIADVVMGIPGRSLVYVVYGSAITPSNTTPLSLTQLTANQGLKINSGSTSPSSIEQFGNAVASVGDIDNDGLSDLLIGSSGTAYLVYGKAINLANLNTSSALTLNNVPSGQVVTLISSPTGSGQYTGLFYGATAGDINNDGYSDFLVGLPSDTPNNRTAAGSLYVLFGGKTFVTANTSNTNNNTLNLSNVSQQGQVQGVKIIGAASSDQIGQAIAAADITGDGLPDLIIGAPSINSTGAAYVIYGTALNNVNSIDLSKLSSTQGYKIINSAAQASDQLGSTVTVIGDINGDGFSDFALGSGKSSSAYVIYGKRADSSQATVDLSQIAQTQSNLGFSITASTSNGLQVFSAGDVNNDGYADLAIGIPGTDTSYIIYGQKNGLSTTATDGTTTHTINLGNYTSYLHTLMNTGSDTGFIGDNITTITKPGISGTVSAKGYVLNVTVDGTEMIMIPPAPISTSTINWSATISTPPNGLPLTTGQHKVTAHNIDYASLDSVPSNALNLVIVDPTHAPKFNSDGTGYTDNDIAFGLPNDWATSAQTHTFQGTGSAPGELLTFFNGTTILGTTLGQADGSWRFSTSLNGGGNPLTIKVSNGAAITSQALIIDQAPSFGPYSVLNRFSDTQARWGIVDINGDGQIDSKDLTHWFDPSSTSDVTTFISGTRLPAQSELKNLNKDVNAAGPPSGWVANGNYWTSEQPSGSSTDYYTVNLGSGNSASSSADNSMNYMAVVLI